MSDKKQNTLNELKNSPEFNTLSEKEEKEVAGGSIQNYPPNPCPPGRTWDSDCHRCVRVVGRCSTEDKSR